MDENENIQTRKCIIPIVEGHGDVAAVQGLIRRCLETKNIYDNDIQVETPIRIPRSKIVKANEFEKAIQLAVKRMAGLPGAVFLVMDADDDCAKELGPRLLQRAKNARPDITVCVTLAVKEFESWFIGNLGAFKQKFAIGAEPPEEPESKRDCKEWFKKNVYNPYKENVDQEKFVYYLDLDPKKNKCKSFGKFIRDVETLIAVLKQ